MRNLCHIKLTILFLLLKISVFPFNSKAQQTITDTTYSFNFHQNTITSIIDSIRIKTYLGVLYNPDYLTSDSLYTNKFHTISLTAILDSILNYFNLNYKIVNSILVISQKNNKIPIIKPNNKLETDSNTFYKYAGEIKEANSLIPIPYVNIYIKNRSIGTISNTEGKFTITIPRELLADSLYFTFIGYQTVTEEIAGLKPTNNIISMKSAEIELKEVIIRNINIGELLKNTIARIPENYCHSPRILTAFYRETLRQSNEYVALSEAILKIYKAPYNGYSNDQISIFKGRKSPFVKSMDTILFKLQGGIYNSLMIDVAKNPSNFMSGENFDLYNYKYNGITSIQNHLAYIIEFDQKEGITYPLYKGKLFINTESLAIIRTEFAISPKGINYAAETMVRKAPRGVKVKPTDVNYVVNYTEQNNIWYLGNIREELKFKVRKRFNLFNTTFHSVIELVITNSDSTNVKRLRSNEIVRSSQIFTEQLTQYDPEFWGNFNYIPPDKSLVEALEEIRGKMGDEVMR